MVLWTGPSGSGKTERILQKLRQFLADGRDDFLLLTPTATLAEHFRNRLAREGWVFSPARIETLSEFLQGLCPGLKVAGYAVERLILNQTLEEDPPAAFREIAIFPGFRQAVANLIGEFRLAGCGAAELERLYSKANLRSEKDQAFLAIYRKVAEKLSKRGLATRAGLLRAAADRVQQGGLSGLREIYFDGFESFSNLELDLIHALSRACATTVTLPVTAAAASSRERLRALGFQEESLERVRALPERRLFVASTETQEAEEIARRILEWRAAGRPFREIGVVVRSEAPFAPVLRTAFARFGIPAHYYFGSQLGAHPVVRFLGGVVDALLAGWDHRKLLEAWKQAAGDDPDFDRFEYVLREKLEAQGLEALPEAPAPKWMMTFGDQAQPMTQWRGSAEPPDVWADRLARLTSLFAPRGLDGGFTGEALDRWRSQAWALRAFRDAMKETEAGLGEAGVMPLAKFWACASEVLRLTELRVPDRRRDVVHVMDAVEARQWELPVVFVCHLLEKEFPKAQAEHPLLGDAARRRLNEFGLRLRTSDEIRRAERDLFESALCRATREVTLSYPRFDRKGDERLRSCFLDEYEGAISAVVPCRPAPSRARTPAPRTVIQSPEAIQAIASLHESFSPTGLETFLICPYRFFLERTLRLVEPPPEPRDRLSPALVGEVAHAAIRRWHASGGDICAVGEELLDEELVKQRIPLSYRVARERVHLRRALSRYAADPRVMPGWRPEFERRVDLKLDGGVRVRGRVDRCDFSPSGEVLVIDFKYSGDTRMAAIRRGYEEGRGLQVDLYLLGLSHERMPAGMAYWCLRGRSGPIYGWYAGLDGWPGVNMTPAELRETLEDARKRAYEAAARVLSGDIRPQPEEESCAGCNGFDICRERVTAVRRAAAGGEQ